MRFREPPQAAPTAPQPYGVSSLFIDDCDRTVAACNGQCQAARRDECIPTLDAEYDTDAGKSCACRRPAAGRSAGFPVDPAIVAVFHK